MNRLIGLIPHLFLKENKPTRIAEHNSAGGSGATIYTVPAGKTGWITGLTIQVSQRAASTYYGYVGFYDSTPTEITRYLFNGNIQAIPIVHIPFDPPFELEASGYVYVWTINADFVINASIYGYET